VTGVDCSILIASRNRREELQKTLEVLVALDPPAREILVCLDGCTDGSERVVGIFQPQVRWISQSPAQGSIPSRTRLAREASGPWLLFLDDDSHPEDRTFLAGLGDVLRRHPGAAVLAFPQRSDEFPESLEARDFGPALKTGTYSSSGALIRKDVFEALGGYPDFFGHAYEEPDFSVRCLAAGFAIVQDPALVIRHRYTGIGRDEIRIHHLHARNEQWSIWMRCPWPWWPWISLRRAAGQWVYACRRGWRWLVREPLWWADAARGMATVLRHRDPVPWCQYRHWMDLLRFPRRVDE
jgi:GT2 family glycosyltransferase